jgi:GTP cyclohydrolase III
VTPINRLVKSVPPASLSKSHIHYRLARQHLYYSTQKKNGVYDNGTNADLMREKSPYENSKIYKVEVSEDDTFDWSDASSSTESLNEIDKSENAVDDNMTEEDILEFALGGDHAVKLNQKVERAIQEDWDRKVR